MIQKSVESIIGRTIDIGMFDDVPENASMSTFEQLSKNS